MASLSWAAPTARFPCLRAAIRPFAAPAPGLPARWHGYRDQGKVTGQNVAVRRENRTTTMRRTNRGLSASCRRQASAIHDAWAGDSAMIQRLVIFGATGDLTARYLLPALTALRTAGDLGDGFELIATAREDWDNQRFRDWAADGLERHAADMPAAARAAIISASRYQRTDIGDPASLAAVMGTDQPVAAYLALPPAVFPAAVSGLHEAGLPAGSRIVLEKPFGEDLDSAIALNELLADVLPEQAIFRVDHFLAMTTVQNLLGTRLANRVLEPLWNSAHIAEVEIIWDESLALEGRAGYYDGVGALKDMLQNHLLQLLCLVAMEPPISLGEADLRDRKVDVLRSVRPLADDEVTRRTRRARYVAGRIGGRDGGHDVPAYIDEDGVDPAHRTETFAEVEFGLDNWRWPDTTFRLRTGKALARDRKEVVFRFRPVPHLPIGVVGDAAPNQLSFGLDPEDLRLELTGIGAHARSLAPLTLTGRLESPDLPGYGRLLHAVLTGDAALSIRGDEAEQSWRVVAPILAAWAKDLVPLEEYPAGSDGPARQHPARQP
jgi:glucose-6-phosphate 1-dehydrogenase